MSDIYNRDWIIANSKEVLSEYFEGITLRQLYYRLVAKGLVNDMKHYKRVVAAMTSARWANIVDMEAFIDRERSMYGYTEADEKDVTEEIENGKTQVGAWMHAYSLNRWWNQDNFVEVWIEKKALQGVFEGPCQSARVGLAPCKGYPSITFLHDASKRFKEARHGKKIIILYFGDHDPSGDNIPVSIEDNLRKLGVEVVLKRIALTTEQIESMGLPGVPPKATDSRTANWDGHTAVECDAIEPHTLTKMCKGAIAEYFDKALLAELRDQESKEKAQYRKALKDFVRNMDLGEDEDEDEDGED